MATRRQARAPFARAAAAAAAVTAVVAISVSAFGAGPASAAASAPPTGGLLESVSCTSARNCTADGVLSFRHARSPLVVSEKNGAWGKAGTITGLSALPGGEQFAGLGPLSCTSKGNCTAGGFYQQKGDPEVAPEQGMIATEKNGVWGQAIPVPGLAAMNVGGQAGIGWMSCRSAGNCTAAGTFFPTPQPDGDVEVFVISERNGTWRQAQQVPGLAAIDNGDSRVSALTCVSPGNCVLAGTYVAGKTFQDYTATQDNGVWGTASTFPAIEKVAINGASMDTLSCRAPGNCIATGTYFTAGDVVHVFAVSEANGTWGAATQIPGFATLPGGPAFIVTGKFLSCPSAGNCTLGGDYNNHHDANQMFVAAEKKGTWGKAEAVPGTVALNAGNGGFLEGLSCPSAGNCTAAGNYTARVKGHLVGATLVTLEKNGKWGKPEQLPGSAALGNDPDVTSMSCGAPGNCSVVGWFSASNPVPFRASEKNGTWGKAQLISGIRP